MSGVVSTYLSEQVNDLHDEPRELMSNISIVREYNIEGFYLGSGGELRCRCSKKACYGILDRNMVLRHISGAIHQRMVANQVLHSTSHLPTCSPFMHVSLCVLNRLSYPTHSLILSLSSTHNK